MRSGLVAESRTRLAFDVALMRAPIGALSIGFTRVMWRFPIGLLRRA